MTTEGACYLNDTRTDLERVRHRVETLRRTLVPDAAVPDEARCLALVATKLEEAQLWLCAVLDPRTVRPPVAP